MNSYFSQPKLEKFDTIAKLEKITLYSDLLKWAELDQSRSQPWFEIDRKISPRVRKYANTA